MSDPRPTHGGPSPTAPAAGLELLAPLLCLIGLCLSGYLTWVHYSLLMGDLSHGQVCGPWGDCNTVIASRYGTLLGLPVSVWGMGFYLVAGTLATAIVLLRREDIPAFVRALVALTGLALAFDVYLAWAMGARLGKFCPLCAATYAVNLLVLISIARLAWDTRRSPAALRSLLPAASVLLRPAAPAYYREVLKLYLAVLSVATCAAVLVLGALLSAAIHQAGNKELASLLHYLPKVPPIEIPTDGLPARGPERAPVTIVVFSDFLCEQCKLANEYLDIVAANHRDSLRVVYAEFPADTACDPFARASTHPGACRMALTAECARRQGRFWPFHDAAFAGPARVTAKKAADYAAAAGVDPRRLDACLVDDRAAPALGRQIELAHAAGVRATPTMFINGRPVVGALKPWMLEEAIKTVAALPAPASAPGQSPPANPSS